MPENDQTRWIGIRPTNPPETIPVSIAAPPACAKVEPCAANTAFNTITKKLTPAISDLQAIECEINYWAEAPANNAAHIVYGNTVPAGKIWVINTIVSWLAGGSVRTRSFSIFTLAVRKARLHHNYQMVGHEPLILHGAIPLMAGQRLGFEFGGAVTGVKSDNSYSGYQIAIY